MATGTHIRVVCGWCKKKEKNEQGVWEPATLPASIFNFLNIGQQNVSHGICPDCVQEHMSLTSLEALPAFLRKG